MVKKTAIFLLLIFAAASGLYWFGNFSHDYSWEAEQRESPEATVAAIIEPMPPLKIPETVRAIYVTAPAAMNSIRVNYLIDLAKSTEINAMVINVKDNSETHLGQWMADLVRKLRKEGVYPIARIVVFQDNYIAQSRPDLVLKNPDGSIFGKTGYQWLDPASKEIWNLNAETAIKALELGFMEINFDYFRFPDGKVDDITYPIYDYSKPKREIIEEAAAYINSRVKAAQPEAVISLDIFADTFLRPIDIGIGQKLTGLASHFDVIAPMIYPSHYASGNFGFDNPADKPYEVVRQTLLAGKKQLEGAGLDVEIRPWIQDFDMGAIYDRQKIQDQIRAIEDVGYQSGWMSWNPSVFYARDKYTK